MKKFIIGENDAGQRVDKFLTKACPAMPKSALYKGIRTKNIKLNLERTSEPLIVRADNDMLKTVVRNFMSNAVKFSPEGSSIDILMTTEGDFAKISVRDHGVGIAADRLGSIFHKGETTYGTSGEEGSGLGLQLCQDFARKNGGDCTVESVEGEGSTFSVLVPLKKE